MEYVIALLGVIAAFGSAWAAFSSNEVSKRMYLVETMPSASVQLSSGLINDSGMFQTEFVNHGRRGCSIRISVLVYSDLIGEWRKCKDAYNGEAPITLQVRQSVHGQFVWDQNVCHPTWPDQLAEIRGGQPVFFVVDAFASDDIDSETELPLARSVYRLTLYPGQQSGLYMEPVFVRDWKKLPKV